MPWSPKVLRSFEKIPNNPSEADFHGPYNKLLYTLFPPDTDFTVVPHYLPASREAADFVVMYEVLLEDKPVLILELEPPGHLRYPSSREAADLRVRSRIRDLTADCPLPVLHAISAMGTRLCFYRKSHDGATEPPPIPAHPDLLSDTAPAERWNHDVLEDEGEQRLRGVVEEIMQGCAAL